jgi:hypothetical protein
MDFTCVRDDITAAIQSDKDRIQQNERLMRKIDSLIITHNHDNQDDISISHLIDGIIHVIPLMIHACHSIDIYTGYHHISPSKTIGDDLHHRLQPKLSRSLPCPHVWPISFFHLLNL